MTTVAIEIDYDALNAHATQLIEAPDSGDEHAEIFAAGEFVFRYGSLGELYAREDSLVELHRAQAARRVPAAWGLIAHWSISRGDPEPNTRIAIGDICPGCSVCPLLEEIHNMRSIFEFERCEECGGDLDVHSAGVDALGHARLICCGRWERAEPLVAEADDVSDDQISSGYSARWIAQLTEGWAVVTRSYYVAHKDDGRVVLERDDYYQAVSDPNEPGATALFSVSSVHELASDDPAAEDVQQLAVESFAPDALEFESAIPNAAPYCNSGA